MPSGWGSSAVALVVFTGGSRSGKSKAAERLALRRAASGQPVTVVVFGREHDSDPEFAERIARHRADRPAHFATLEASDPAAWREGAGVDSLVVLDCLGTLLGLVMEAAWESLAPQSALVDAPADALPAGYEAACERGLADAIEWLLAREGDTIVVTNEVGSGPVPAFATGRLFCDLLGRANRRLVDVADASYACVAGRLIALDALSREASWPED
jgi:adenosylcobinamide kinase/adenosylcobinamide-phosphate guanylyltransferase